MKGLVKYARGKKQRWRCARWPNGPLEPQSCASGWKAAGICGSDCHIYPTRSRSPSACHWCWGTEFSRRWWEIGAEVPARSLLGRRVSRHAQRVASAGCAGYLPGGRHTTCVSAGESGMLARRGLCYLCDCLNAARWPCPRRWISAPGPWPEPLACAVHVCEQTRISAGDLVLAHRRAEGHRPALPPGGQGRGQAGPGLRPEKGPAARLELARSLGADHVAVVEQEDVGSGSAPAGEQCGADVLPSSVRATLPRTRLASETGGQGELYRPSGPVRKPVQIDSGAGGGARDQVRGSFGHQAHRLETHPQVARHWPGRTTPA